jgi:hypothetical protein
MQADHETIGDRIPLEVLLWVDQQYRSLATLSECIGDSYLYAQNPLFRAVRDAALGLGIRFSAEADSMWRNYAVAPLFTLKDILGRGIVPYRGDMEVLRAIAVARPDSNLDAHEIVSLLAGNRVMHESSHAVADRYLLSIDWRPPKEYAHLEPVLRGLLGEAFANTVETLGNAYVVQEAHRLFYSLHSYMGNYHKEHRALLRASVSVFGINALLEYGIWVFFHLNMHPQKRIPSDTFLSIAGLSILSSEISDGHRELFESIGPILFTLNENFRRTTTPLYLQISGDEEPFNQLGSLEVTSLADLEAIGLVTGIKALGSHCVSWLPTSQDRSGPEHRVAVRNDTVISLANDVASDNHQAGVTVLNRRSGQLYTFEGPGHQFLTWLDRPRSCGDLQQLWARTAGIDVECARDEIVAFLEELLREELINVLS